MSGAATRVRKQYGSTTAVAHLDLEVHPPKCWPCWAQRCGQNHRGRDVRGFIRPDAGTSRCSV
ncbi:hypothetical protein I552_0031 [Mycobacterium xenopi 3993]|nr:hypothetical protein I552_0031 [Mycobacterium xenopi 3993]